ncbi:MAG: hypothetical protein ACJAS1_000580 [Oleiphilaceae bacterium]|jgi:hypothetical protein
MSFIKKIKISNSLIIGVDSSEIIENIADKFDCHTRSEDSTEVILDVVFLDDDDRFNSLCALLNISSVDHQASTIRGADFVIFHS